MTDAMNFKLDPPEVPQPTLLDEEIITRDWPMPEPRPAPSSQLLEKIEPLNQLSNQLSGNPGLLNQKQSWVRRLMLWRFP